MKMKEELFDFLSPIVGDDMARVFLSTPFNNIKSAYETRLMGGDVYAVIYALGGSGK